MKGLRILPVALLLTTLPCPTIQANQDDPHIVAVMELAPAPSNGAAAAQRDSVSDVSMKAYRLSDNSVTVVGEATVHPSTTASAISYTVNLETRQYGYRALDPKAVAAALRNDTTIDITPSLNSGTTNPLADARVAEVIQSSMDAGLSIDQLVAQLNAGEPVVQATPRAQVAAAPNSWCWWPCNNGLQVDYENFRNQWKWTRAGVATRGLAGYLLTNHNVTLLHHIEASGFQRWYRAWRQTWKRKPHHPPSSLPTTWFRYPHSYRWNKPTPVSRTLSPISTYMEARYYNKDFNFDALETHVKQSITLTVTPDKGFSYQWSHSESGEGTSILRGVAYHCQTNNSKCPFLTTKESAIWYSFTDPVY